MANGYIHYNSLKTIIQDILNTFKSNSIAESDTISSNQIEQWIHQYRAMLIKQDLDKGRYVNETYTQDLNGIEMEPYDFSELAGRKLGFYVFRSKTRIPKTIDLHFKNGILKISTITGTEIQLMPESRAMIQIDRRWANHDTIAFMQDDYVYVMSDKKVKLINVKAIFEIPTEVQNVLTNKGYIDYDYDAPYQCPANMISTIKELIYSKDLYIMTSMSSDDTNDKSDDSSLVNKNKLYNIYKKQNVSKSLRLQQ